MLKIIKKNKKGFTLIEVMVSMSIFIVIMVSSSVVFALIFKAYRGAKDVNENLKNSQYALNLITKTLRTSSLKYPNPASNTSSTRVVIYDYSQNLCIRYRFNAGVLDVSKLAVAEAACVDGAFGTAVVSTMTTGAVSGSFRSTNSSGDDLTGKSLQVGRITIMMNITNGTNTATIQSTASLRDYTTSNIGIDFVNPS